MRPHLFVLATVVGVDTAGPNIKSPYPHIIATICRHLHTAVLFTWTDYKTIFIPVVGP